MHGEAEVPAGFALLTSLARPFELAKPGRPCERQNVEVEIAGRPAALPRTLRPSRCARKDHQERQNPDRRQAARADQGRAILQAGL